MQVLFHRLFGWPTDHGKQLVTILDQLPPDDDYGTTGLVVILKPYTHPKASIKAIHKKPLGSSTSQADSLVHKLFSVNSICLILY